MTSTWELQFFLLNGFFLWSEFTSCWSRFKWEKAIIYQQFSELFCEYVGRAFESLHNIKALTLIRRCHFCYLTQILLQVDSYPLMPSQHNRMILYGINPEWGNDRCRSRCLWSVSWLVSLPSITPCKRLWSVRHFLQRILNLLNKTIGSGTSIKFIDLTCGYLTPYNNTKFNRS